MLLTARIEAKDPFTIPAWLTPYPGANEEITTSRGMAVASYQTPASVGEVVAFHRDLFAARGIPFQPEMYGAAALIRADTEDCGLTIQIRQEKSRTTVQITAAERPVIHKLTESDIRRSMEKYDKPVYPAPKVPLPALNWPSWLASYGVQASPVRKGVDRFRNQYLESEFDSTEARGEIETFYADLLEGHEYRVTVESSPITPARQPAIVEGTHSFEHSGRFVIRVDLLPAAPGVHVVVRITAHP